MADVGLKISQGSYDARTAADYQFVFNSSWPSLQAVFEYAGTVLPSSTVTVAHGRTFPPFAVGWVMNGTGTYGRSFVGSSNFVEPRQTEAVISVDSNNLYIQNTSAGLVLTVSVKCYNLDISKAADYTNPKAPSANAPYDPNFGIKLSKFGKDVRSKDLRDFIIHSRAQSPALLSVVRGNSTNTVVTYENPENYVPWTFAFYQSAGAYYGISPGHQQTGARFQLGKNISFTQGDTTYTVASGALLASTIANTELSLVVLRDPLVAANIVDVTY